VLFYVRSLRMRRRIIAERHHRAAESLLEGGYEFVLRLDGEIKPVVLLGEALGLGDALLARPGETFTRKPIVNCELRGFCMELLGKLAGGPFARLFAVGKHNDDARLRAKFEGIGRLFDGRGQWTGTKALTVPMIRSAAFGVGL